MLTHRITFYKVINFNQISCCYSRIKFHWRIFPKAVNGNGWKLMGWAAGPAVVCPVAIRGVITDY
jgi:hypothetical protein